MTTARRMTDEERRQFLEEEKETWPDARLEETPIFIAQASGFCGYGTTELEAEADLAAALKPVASSI